MVRDTPERQSDFILYTDPEGNVKVEVIIKDDTVWLSQKVMAELFGVDRTSITKHLKNIYDEGELKENSVSEVFSHTAPDGKNYSTKFYNLDAIIAIGYRINSFRATRFRIWATKILKEYLIKGFVLDDDRLKQGSTLFGKDYFEELLERIREIRASERRFYQKITDIYSTSIDYDRNALITKDFFSKVQNKLHWAITGKTAAEIIYDKADADKAHMGLTSWKRAPKGKILKSDVTIAKNYLDVEHIQELNRLVSAYLDLAENRAKKHVTTTMEDWANFLDGFLELSDYPILEDKGKVTMLEAKIKAESEYEKFRIIQDEEFISDFDEVVKRITSKKRGK